jgi:hypothetical protein
VTYIGSSGVRSPAPAPTGGGCPPRSKRYRQGDRHCPKCQASKRAAWLEARLERLLPVGYFHVVFTLPASLLPLVLHNQRLLALRLPTPRRDNTFGSVQETLKFAGT